MIEERVRPATAAIWDGAALFAALSGATNLLASHKAAINALNVFPVPDGDTGANMAATMDAAIEEAAKLDRPRALNAAAVAERVAYGALMGARGNSGVILSQIFRGFAKGLANRDAIEGRDLALGLEAAKDMAYKAVMKPVEGTMLTVIRVAAEHAQVASKRSRSIQIVLGEALRGAESALAATPDLLDLLRQAGVVDAGGQGIVHLLSGLERYARGETILPGIAAEPSAADDMAFLDRVDVLHGEEAYGYCTNFMIFGVGIPFDEIRAELGAMGQSAVIVGDENVVKAHIHTPNPGALLEYALRFGELGQIKIDNMNAQVVALTERRRGDAPPAVQRLVIEAAPLGSCAVIAVAAGTGLARALESMGATASIAGGQSMNPSIEEMLSAVERAPCDDVILLPNNANILLAAHQIPALTTKRVRIVPARSIPQGLSALSAFNPDNDLNSNTVAMTSALRSVRTVEITRADKDATIDGVTARRGQVIGLVDDQLVASGENEVAVTSDALDHAGAASADLITIFTGEGAAAADADPLLHEISTRFAGVPTEVYEGGQPHYRFVISVE